ncbi:Zinc transporter ZIP9 [Pseudocercospora fuligena]|uniref:Zinc transporter ZIP9 n=1 Tax=Pseudocercospora fuligena TaxID=685502 RepID=A0A8H6RM38_9PEZI|nr:Zinc transporter ZIP9 [Pseudocercospora fuligena]
MWDGLLLLLLLGIVMGTASFFAGIVPLALSLSSRQLRLITALGTGVLVGTSLIVIIPEGVETLYAASGTTHGHQERGLSTRNNVAITPATFVSLHQRDAIPFAYAIDEDHPGFRSGPDDGFQTAPDAADSDPESSDPGHEPGVAVGSPEDAPGRETKTETTDREPHAWIGISVILGFILMYLIDTLPQHASSPSRPQRFHISLNQFSLNRRSISEESPPEPEAGTFAGVDQDSHSHNARPASTTIGLVIHAAADGIALGASSTTSSNLSFIIFIALMIHKAPAAFGLTSVLLKQGLSKRMARAHLIVFSLAAPVGAIITFLGVHLLGFANAFGESASTEFATGVLLLFSGGTFLYVAMHTMQESSSARHSHGEGHGMNGYAGVPSDDPYGAQMPSSSKASGPQLTDTLVTVGGMLLPLLTQWGHAH